MPSSKPIGNTVARYVIQLSAVRDESPDRLPVIIHDTRSPDELCKLGDVDPIDRSYFNNLDWAMGRGYRPCPYCMAWLTPVGNPDPDE